MAIQNFVQKLPKMICNTKACHSLLIGLFMLLFMSMLDILTVLTRSFQHVMGKLFGNTEETGCCNYDPWHREVMKQLYIQLCLSALPVAYILLGITYLVMKKRDNAKGKKFGIMIQMLKNPSKRDLMMNKAVIASIDAAFGLLLVITVFNCAYGYVNIKTWLITIIYSALFVQFNVYMYWCDQMLQKVIDKLETRRKEIKDKTARGNMDDSSDETEMKKPHKQPAESDVSSSMKGSVNFAGGFITIPEFYNASTYKKGSAWTTNNDEKSSFGNTTTKNDDRDNTNTHPYRGQDYRGGKGSVCGNGYGLFEEKLGEVLHGSIRGTANGNGYGPARGNAYRTANDINGTQQGNLYGTGSGSVHSTGLGNVYWPTMPKVYGVPPGQLEPIFGNGYGNILDHMTFPNMGNIYGFGNNNRAAQGDMYGSGYTFPPPPPSYSECQREANRVSSNIDGFKPRPADEATPVDFQDYIKKYLARNANGASKQSNAVDGPKLA